MTKPTLQVTSAFADRGKMPIEYTGRGRDISPALHLSKLADGAVSIAIIMDDVDHPLFKPYTHWVIWNLPAIREIPADIPHGETLPELNGAVQGVGYGRHRYRGPKPPFNMRHLYQFDVYVLDCRLDLSPKSRKRDLIRAMEGHVLQHGQLLGEYK